MLVTEYLRQLIYKGQWSQGMKHGRDLGEGNIGSTMVHYLLQIMYVHTIFHLLLSR